MLKHLFFNIYSFQVKNWSVLYKQTGNPKAVNDTQDKTCTGKSHAAVSSTDDTSTLMYLCGDPNSQGLYRFFKWTYLVQKNISVTMSWISMARTIECIIMLFFSFQISFEIACTKEDAHGHWSVLLFTVVQAQCRDGYSNAELHSGS